MSIGVSLVRFRLWPPFLTLLSRALSSIAARRARQHYGAQEMFYAEVVYLTMNKSLVLHRAVFSKFEFDSSVTERAATPAKRLWGVRIGHSEGLPIDWRHDLNCNDRIAGTVARVRF